MKCQSWRFVSFIGAAVKYGLGFLWRSLLSFRRRRVEGEDILVFVSLDRIRFRVEDVLRLNWTCWEEERAIRQKDKDDSCPGFAGE